MSARALPLATLLFGLATLAVFLAFGAMPEVRAVYAPAEVGLAVSEFQRAESEVDLIRVFATPADPTRLAAMDAINTLDLYAFVPAYALFLGFAALMLGGPRNRWTQAAIAFALIGALADAIETWKQLQITNDIANAAAHLPLAPWHWLKYAALALNGVAIASLCIAADRKRWVVAVLALAPFPLVAAAYMELISPRLFSAAFALYWIALLGTGAAELLRKRAALVEDNVRLTAH